LPSWREGLPRSAIEAAASGLPLVLTDIRGCREVARPEIEGLLVPTRDPERLAAAILQLVRDPAMRKRMGEAARTRAEAMFDERRVTSTVVRVTDARRRVTNTRSTGTRSVPFQQASPVGGGRG
jgi:glycosyltransferase involved in cell wall biosynthesis